MIKYEGPNFSTPFKGSSKIGTYSMVAGVGFEPHDLRVMSPTSYRTAPSRDVLTLRIIYHIEQSVKHFFALQVSRLLVRNGSRINITTISHYKVVFHLTLMLFMI